MKAALKLDEDGFDFEVCPRDERHAISRDPKGLYCRDCGEHLQEPTQEERIRFRLTQRR